MQFIICDSCQEKDIHCPVCLGQRMALSFANHFFYWQKIMTRLNIYHARVLKLIKKIIDALLFIFVLIVWLSVLFFCYKFIVNGGDVFTFFARKNILMQIFWLTALVALYLAYRIFGAKVSAETVIKLNLDDLKKSVKISQDVWSEKNKLLKKANVSRAFDYESLDLIERSFLLAEKQGCFLAPAHIFYQLLEKKQTQNYLFRLNLDVSQIRVHLERIFVNLEKGSGVSLSATKLFLQSYLEACLTRREFVALEEILVALNFEEGQVKDLLIDLEIDENKMRQVVAWKRIQQKIAKHWRNLQNRAATKPKHEVNRSYTAAVSPFLDQFSEDLTQLARSGHLEPTVGKEQELVALFNCFNAGKDGVVLVGERGVGKSFVTESLAELMAAEEVPILFQDKRLVRLSVSALIAGADAPGAIEARLLAILKEVRRAGNIILVIDNIEALIGLGTESSASLDLAQVLAEELEKRYFLMIAIADKEKYNAYLKNSLLGQLLAVVNVNEPESDAAIRILETKTPYLEHKYQIFFSYQALDKAVELTTKYVHNQFLPVKAITALEQTASFVLQTKGHNALVTAEDVAAVISKNVKIPLTKVTETESDKLLNLEQEIHFRIIDQVEAVSAVAEALRRARANLVQGKRPIASFLFLGPTGVGKTEVARVLSEIYFGGLEHFIRLDMSEYGGADAVNKLIGFAGAQAGGYLTSQVKDKPFALVLLDEFEKAVTEAHNLFLQVMEDGRLTDANGETVDFTNTIIIATSNAGTDLIQNGLKAGQTIADIKQELVENKLSEYFRLELLNRFDGIIVFKPLSMSEVVAITKLLLDKLNKVLADKGIVLECKEEAIEQIAKAGFDESLGARPLRRVIQDKIENEIAKLILAKKVSRRDKIVLNSLDEIKIEKAK